MIALALALQVVSAPAVSVDQAARDTAAAAQAAAVAAQTAASTACQPDPSIPPMETVGGSAGSGAACRLANAVQPRITRAAVVTTDNTGAWSVTWSVALPAVPVVLPVPVNATTQPVVCNVATRTASGATGRCWLARTLPATLVTLTSLITYDVFGAPASSIQVQALAIPVTQ